MWLHIPSSVLPPVAVGSTPGFTSHSAEEAARSVTWRTKQLPPQRWSQAWKRNSWMTRLSGLTCELSTAQRGAGSWMASLAATRVSHSASQDGAEEQTTLDTSGPTLPTSSGQLSLDGAFSRTSAVICDWDSEKSPKSFEAWATALRRHCGARRKLALLTAENVSSSSLWTTPTKGDGDGGQTQPSAARRQGGGDRSLRVDAAQWPTPTSRDEASSGAQGYSSPGHHSGTTLTDAMRQWPTQNAHDGRRPGSDATSTQGANLKREAEQWATPMRSDDGRKVTTASLQNNLISQQADWAGRQGLQATGQVSLNSYGRPRLNPLFVAWLMGPYWLQLLSRQRQWCDE